MFNGIIYNTGKVKQIFKDKNSIYIGIKTNLKFIKKDIGSSVSCNGVCLTLTKIANNLIFFYISKETLFRSNLKYINVDDLINLEKSIVFGQKISGNFVQGHIDTTANVSKIKILDKTWLVKFRLNNNKLSKYLVEKASISINGVSLTISKTKNDFFEISIIPHTLKLTNLTNLNKNSLVNVELDIFCKYLIKITN